MNRLSHIDVAMIMVVPVMIAGLTGCAADQAASRGHEVHHAGPSSPIVAPSAAPATFSHPATPEDARAVARIADALEAPPHHVEEGAPADTTSPLLPAPVTVQQASSPESSDAGQSIMVLRRAAPSVHGLDRSHWPTLYFIRPIGTTTHFPTYTKFSELPVRSPALFEPTVSGSQRVAWALSGSQSGILDGNGAWETVKEFAKVAGDLALFPARVVMTPPWTTRTTP